MSSLDSKNFEQAQIVRPVRLAIKVAGGATDGAVVQAEGSCRCFSLDEVLIATKNFDDTLVIGNGGFGKVYKGFIDNGKTVVAIKRLNAESKQGAGEFWTEIKTLSKLRHVHLVTLIGYCDEGQEMALVYEYIARGTLADHLYKLSSTKNNTNIAPLSWEQRLNICIGAAHGLDHLHGGTNQSFIHRDVKTTNILLDENWTAKISDFGLSKDTTSHSITHISTNVKGTFGYLDPDYFLTQRLTTKSDVYAFGVVLLEVLCGRQPVDRKLGEEQISLVYWAQQCIKKGKLDGVIDPSLSGQIVPRCLKSFVILANNCLRKAPKSRPSMAEVVDSLVLALLSQQRVATGGVITKAFQSMDRWLRFSTSFEQSNDSSREKKDISSSSGQSTDSPRERKDISSSSGQSNDSHQKSYSNGVTQLYRHFSFTEIRVATNNFDKSLLVPNSNKVYKGSIRIDGKTQVVAIKRFNKLEAVGVEMHVKTPLFHRHVVSPIGLRTEEHELILVYYYMSKGSLQDYLYSLDPQDPPLPWKTRLEICIGAAKGIGYLQADAERKLIQRCIEPSNILLDENWVAKLMVPDIRTTNKSRAGTSRSTTTQFDSLDQEENDLFAFGVMLLEVLTGNKELDTYRNPKHRDVPLLCTLKNVLQSENIYDAINVYLTGKIGPECLREFVKTTLSCLFQQGIRRPSLDYVVRSLQFAVDLQETWESSITKSTDRLQSRLNKDIFAKIGQTVPNRIPGYGWTEGPFGTTFIN